MAKTYISTVLGGPVPIVGNINSFMDDAYSFPAMAGGRLTLAAATPVMTSSVPGATSIVYTPYRGLWTPVWNATQGMFVMVNAGGDVSQLLTDATKSPAAAASSSVYDMFFWLDGTTPRCTRGPVWASTSTRSMALTNLQGIRVNSTAITNGPGQYQGTYVGTIYTNGSATCDWILGVPASGGTAAWLGVWNTFNRVHVCTRVTDTGAPYTYMGGIRQARGSTGMQVNYVVGVAEDSPIISFQTTIQTPGVSGVYGSVSVGDDSISYFEIPGGICYSNGPATNLDSVCAMYQKGYGEPMIGLHYAAALEMTGDTVNAVTFNTQSKAELAFTMPM